MKYILIILFLSIYIHLSATANKIHNELMICSSKSGDYRAELDLEKEIRNFKKIEDGSDILQAYGNSPNLGIFNIYDTRNNQLKKIYVVDVNDGFVFADLSNNMLHAGSGYDLIRGKIHNDFQLTYNIKIQEGSMMIFGERYNIQNCTLPKTLLSNSNKSINNSDINSNIHIKN
ncbi:hypothetical protein N9N67_01750 [Bacteriovoracaceae bacterium]|nr:hypothetical protein [Bacteriovoracaceae bacterium]